MQFLEKWNPSPILTAVPRLVLTGLVSASSVGMVFPPLWRADEWIFWLFFSGGCLV